MQRRPEAGKQASGHSASGRRRRRTAPMAPVAARRRPLLRALLPLSITRWPSRLTDLTVLTAVTDLTTKSQTQAKPVLVQRSGAVRPCLVLHFCRSCCECGAHAEAPPPMWPCERLVLNGDYPAAALRRMSVPTLERLVAKLVRRTAAGTAARPRWWPTDFSFTNPKDLGLSLKREHDGDVRLAFKQLIASCCRFFEERRRLPTAPSRHFLEALRLFPVDDISSKKKTTPSALPPTPPPPAPPPPKLSACVAVPFSSDMGRRLAAREGHFVSEEVKLKRLEKNEWYTNRNRGAAKQAKEPNRTTEVPKGETLESCHVYKMPKRQFHQRRNTMHDAEFLEQFCTPVKVVLKRVNLKEFKYKVSKTKRKQLVVKIKDTEKMCCDLRSEVRVHVRSSPRLRNV